MAVGPDIGIGLAAVGAGAAAVSASFSARAVALSHRPYVYGERAPLTMVVGQVRLHNDGPGTAVEVRFRVGAPGVEPTDWSEPVRAMQPGEVLPPEGGGVEFTMEIPAGVNGGHSDSWYVETEFNDIRGARWQLRNERGNANAAASLRRMRTGWLDLWRPRS